MLIKDELNVKIVSPSPSPSPSPSSSPFDIELITVMTPELKLEGIKRELVRAINNARKEAGMTIQDKAVVYYETASKEIKEVFEKFGEEIKKDTLAEEIVEGGGGKAVKINDVEIILRVEKR